MPAPVVAAIIGAGAAVGTTAVTVRSVGKSAKKQEASANRAAELQAQSASEALAFQREEAARAQAEAEATRRANYDQWAAGQRRTGYLGELLGLPPLDIPAYVPIQSGQTGTLGPLVAGAPRGLDQARQGFEALFPDQTLTPEMLRAKEAELNRLGFQLRPNAAGIVGKIQYGPNGPIIDVIQGASSGLNRRQWLTPQTAPTGSRGTLGAALSPLPYAHSTLSPPLPFYPWGTLGGSLYG